MSKKPYFKFFENRKPYQPINLGGWHHYLFILLSVFLLGIGINYLYWRWTVSLNEHAIVFSTALAVAETLMFIGSLLMIFNYSSILEIKKRKPVRQLSDIQELKQGEEDRPIKIDLCVATYNEPISVLEETIRDASNVTYKYDDVEIRLLVLDDGNRQGGDERENVKSLAGKYNALYLSRESNEGFKAGNLNHYFWQSDSDLMVIIDADTRLFPDFLNETTGYFRDKSMAWVQTPQWFYDIHQGRRLSHIFPKLFGFLSNSAFDLNVGYNILGTDSQYFYDSVLRHRNSSNAAFCCGAGSIHRRHALIDLISNNAMQAETCKVHIPTEKITDQKLRDIYSQEKHMWGPFVHHISEDIYTSILVHSLPANYKSYQTKTPLSKMLSPQSVDGFVKQYERYAKGTFDIIFSRHNPAWKKGLSVKQRLAYLETVFAYLSAFWIVVFLLSPILFFFTLMPPIHAFNFDFFIRFFLFMLVNTAVVTLANWGLPTKRNEQYFFASFAYKISAFFSIIFKKSLQFNVTKKTLDKSKRAKQVKHIIPHATFITLTFAGMIYNAYFVYHNQHPSTSGFAANSVWALYNVFQLSPMVRAAFMNLPNTKEPNA